MNKSYFQRLREYVLPLLLWAYAGAVGRHLLLCMDRGSYSHLLVELAYVAPLMLMLAIVGYFVITELLRRGKPTWAGRVRGLLIAIFAALHVPALESLVSYANEILSDSRILFYHNVGGGTAGMALILIGVVLLVVRIWRMRKGIAPIGDTAKRRIHVAMGLGAMFVAAGLWNMIISVGRVFFPRKRPTLGMIVIGLLLMLLPCLKGYTQRLKIPEEIKQKLKIPEKIKQWQGWGWVPAALCIGAGLAMLRLVALNKYIDWGMSSFALLFNILYVLCAVLPFLKAMHKLELQIDEAAQQEIGVAAEQTGKAEKICSIAVSVLCLMVVLEVVFYKWVLPYNPKLTYSGINLFLSGSIIYGSDTLLNIPAYFAIVRSPYGGFGTPAISNGICVLMLVGAAVPELCEKAFAAVGHGVQKALRSIGAFAAGVYGNIKTKISQSASGQENGTDAKNPAKEHAGALAGVFAAAWRGILKGLNGIAYFAGRVYGTVKAKILKMDSEENQGMKIKIPQWAWLALIGVVIILLALNLGASLLGKGLPGGGNSGFKGVLSIFVDDDDDSESAPAPVKPKNCTSCYGSEECSKCLGSGECEKCGGEGGRWCTYCSGTGTCGKCDGRGGEWYYPVGGSSRWLECTHCDGSLRCSYCDGGENPCYMCNSTGNCFSCKGTGDCPYCD